MASIPILLLRDFYSFNDLLIFTSPFQKGFLGVWVWVWVVLVGFFKIRSNLFLCCLLFGKILIFKHLFYISTCTNPNKCFNEKIKRGEKKSPNPKQYVIIPCKY